MIKVYRKTATIKAEQFDGSDEMVKKYHIEFDDEYVLPFRIETLEEWLGVAVGDWIATGVNGEHWAIADDVFKKTYAELDERVEEKKYYVKIFDGGLGYLNIDISTGNMTAGSVRETDFLKTKFTNKAIEQLKQRDDIPLYWDKVRFEEANWPGLHC